VAPDLHEIFSGNDDSTVSVVDIDASSPNVDSIVQTIDMHGQGVSDLIDYDPKDHIIIVTNPDDGFVTLIDAPSRTVLTRITGLQVIDQPRYNPADGLFYLSGTDANALYAIDPRSRKLVSTAILPVACEPHGLAVNPATNQGLIGCGYKEHPLTLAWDFATNTMIRTFDQAGAGDAVIYDAIADHFYFAASSYTPPEMAVFSGSSPITYLTAVPTSHKSHTVAYDEVHRTIYTFDGLHRQAGLWTFQDPLPR
jgi:DNA-binding beta-propeller fold protein YncE